MAKSGTKPGLFKEWNTFEAGHEARKDTKVWGKPPDMLILDWMTHLLSPASDDLDRGRGVIAHCLEELKAESEGPK